MIFEIFLEVIRLDVIFSYIVWLFYNPLIGNVKLESITARCISLLGLFFTGSCLKMLKLHIVDLYVLAAISRRQEALFPVRPSANTNL